MAAGVSDADVRTALVSTGLALSNGVREVAWTTDGDALYFFGVPTQELYAPENVYWLTFGQGRAMETADATPAAGGATNQWFMRAESYRAAFLAPRDARDRRSTSGTLTNALVFGEWIPGSAAESERAKSQTVVLPGFCASALTGVVARVSAVSYRDFSTPDAQTCEVWLNDTNCGSGSWSGEQAVVFDCAAGQGVATNGPLKLTVRNGLTAPLNDFMLLDLALHYPRAYVAEGGMLLCAGGVGQTVAVSGLTTNVVGVWDVTDADTPAVLDAPLWPETNGLWQVAFACGDASARYAVFGAAGGCYEPSVTGVRGTDWRAAGEMPELAIVVPPRRWVSGFAAAVQPLADFRNAQGLRTRVIDAEELYNAFSDGLAHPKAFQKFSAAGVTNGAVPTLRYLLFAGHGGSDYKLEVFRLGEAAPYPALFPLYLKSQVDGLAKGALLLPNDPALGDVSGGAVPEVAVGRFVAADAEELVCMVAKTIRYELTETWKAKAVFSADWQNEGAKYVNFAGIASSTAGGFPQAGWQVTSFYPGPLESNMNPFWKNTLNGTGVDYELHKGAGFFYFVGHSQDTLAGDTFANKLFDSTTLISADWTFAPVALLMGCRMGRWTLLDLVNRQRCIAEAGVRNRNSGFAAVISASGYMSVAEATDFSNGFRNQIAAGASRLGDAWRGAFAYLGDARAANLQHMVLLGDPSLCIRAVGTARGTPSSWLIGHGLTNNAYADLSDQDVDGFATWQEYQAGTDPWQGGVRILTLAPPSANASGLPLAFELLGGKSYHVLSTTNLTSGGVWEPVLWRADANAAWSNGAIPGDWPLKAVEVPYSSGEPQRFYKIGSE